MQATTPGAQLCRPRPRGAPSLTPREGRQGWAGGLPRPPRTGSETARAPSGTKGAQSAWATSRQGSAA
eukprot:9480338-Alexandrium_andersonii.AAC.1